MTATKAPNAPTAATTDLECTHYYCRACNNQWPVADGVGCGFCGELVDIGFEHHSKTPLGYRNDKAHAWTLPLGGDVWIYEAKAPAA